MTREPNERAIEAAADAIGNHEYRVDKNTWVPSCTCGWTADAAYDIPAYDRHVAADALEAALPHIRAAMPHLRRTIPNTVDTLHNLPVGTVVRATSGEVYVRGSLAWWVQAGEEQVCSDGYLASPLSGITEWTVLLEGGDE